jgi:hypothetical protein
LFAGLIHPNSRNAMPRLRLRRTRSAWRSRRAYSVYVMMIELAR